MCKEFNCLPQPGSLLDQDWYMVYALQCVAEGNSIKQEQENRRAKRRKK